MQFGVIKTAKFISNPKASYNLPEYEQLNLLLFIKNSLI